MAVDLLVLVLRIFPPPFSACELDLARPNVRFKGIGAVAGAGLSVGDKYWNLIGWKF
jgi:hypothetical protein